MKVRPVLAALALATGCAVEGEAHVAAPAVAVQIDDAPPAVEVHVVEVRPGFVWIEGRYERVGRSWRWREGYYERERLGYIWEQGRWVRQGGRHVWMEGHWRPR